MSRNTLIIGNGGRESAIVRELQHSGMRREEIFALTQNAQTEKCTTLFPQSVEAICHGTANWDDFHPIDLVIVGPEQPLANGIVDQVLAKTLCRVFGPTQKLAKLESSKWFAKNVMQRLGVPTASATIHNRVEAIHEIHRLGKRGLQQVVLKLDGLMGGKGVLLPETEEEAIGHVNKCFKSSDPNEPLMLFEQRLRDGVEVSMTAMADGDQYVLFPPAMDYKRAHEDDSENDDMTGGMGVIAPAPIISDVQWEMLGCRIIQPLMRWAKEANPRGFRGCIYAGLKITPDGKAHVLEINVRMGDPETQAILPLIKVSAYDLFHACATGTLQELVGKEGLGKMLPYYGCSIAVAVTSESYPEPHQGELIRLPVPEERLPIFVDLLHANTQPDENGQAASTGGRIIYVCGYGDDHARARSSAYSYLQEAGFTNVRWRTDIGANIPTVNLKL